MVKRIKERIFHMKQFDVCHSRSANKVGVDGVLIGAWACIPAGCRRVLDAGCGCGLISLMLAQRSDSALIEGIEIDPEGAAEAAENAARSPWSGRIRINCADFANVVKSVESGGEGIYDAIVSNPPFFNAGLGTPGTRREVARHADTLSPEALLRSGGVLLRRGGVLSLICQYESAGHLLEYGRGCGLIPVRMTAVRGNPRAAAKRMMMEWMRPHADIPGSVDPGRIEEDGLTIELSPGEYTADYVNLCRDFYINM